MSAAQDEQPDDLDPELDDLAEKDPSLPREAMSFLQTFTEDLIRSGDIDPRGKTMRAVVDEARAWVREHVDEDFRFHLRVDYSQTLLREARRFRDEGEAQLALVMYATYFEHWLNDMIAARAGQLNLDQDETIGLIRSSGLPAKTGFLWRLIYGEALDEDLSGGIRQIAERRNAFVHYKWKGKDPEDLAGEDQGAAALAFRADELVAAAESVTDRLLYHGARPRLSES